MTHPGHGLEPTFTMPEEGAPLGRLQESARPGDSARPSERRLALLRRAAIRAQREGVVQWRDAVYRRSAAVADAAAAAITLLATHEIVGPAHPDLVALAIVPLIAIVGKVIGLYDRQESVVHKSTLDEVPQLLQLAALFALITWLINGSVLTGTSDRRELLVMMGSLALLLPCCRAAARLIVRGSTVPERCLVIGDGPVCERIRAKLESHGSLHARVAAHVPIDAFGDEHQSLGVLSKRDDLGALIAGYRVDRVVIAPESADADEVLNVIRSATSFGVKVSVVPRLLEVVGSAVEFDEIEGLPLLSMRGTGLARSSRAIKRTLDITLSLLGLACLAPAMILIAIAIRLETRGPAFFRQRRIGRDGEPFEMLKFRTMLVGAHVKRDELRHLNEAQGLFKIEKDPRITRVGSLLRRASLDELPQLLNVLRGDMSLVGPRPLVAEEDSLIQGWHRRRLQLTPGMTGHWQILGSARIPLHEMVNIDYLYVTNWSLWNDLKILLRTIPYVAQRRGM